MATDYIISLFRIPLEAKGASLSSFNDELEEYLLGESFLIFGKKITEKFGTNFIQLATQKYWPTVLLQLAVLKGDSLSLR